MHTFIRWTQFFAALFALATLVFSCQSGSDLVFPKLGCKYFDKFVKDD